MSRSRGQKRSRPGTTWQRCLVGGVLWGCAAFLISLVLVVSGFLTYAKRFLQSERFQRMIETKVSEALAAEVELGEVRWEGSSAFADRVSGSGYEDAGFAKFGLAGLRTDFDFSLKQFQRRVWKVESFGVSQLDVLFSDAGRAVRVRGAEESGEAGPRASANLLGEWVPRALEWDELRLNTLNLYWEAPGRKVTATGMHTLVKPEAGSGGFAVEVRGGAVQGTEVPKLEIDRVDLRWKGREIFVADAKLRSQEGALLALDGEIRLGEKEKPGGMRLDARVTQIPVGKLFQEKGGSRLEGEAQVEVRIEGDPGDLKNSRQEGRVTLRNGMVGTLPVLVMLARFTGSKRFERIALRDGGGAKFVRNQGRTVFSGIDFQSDGLGRLTGDLVVEQGNLSGVLQLGVIPGTLSWIPAAEQKIFTESRDGHLWTPVRVSGTVEHPQHDLTARLAGPGVEAAVDMLGKILDGGKKSGDESGEKPEGALPGAAEQLGNAVDMGRELLKGFFR